ncbi:hypothetical protein HJFPF1_12678 [Paramyrothecium foliicola]|nr:hypothetical protein HJFPF1_12678 [Paramyrothecium foliicola]
MAHHATPRSSQSALKPITCLNADAHDSENITDKLIHYVGCIQYCEREAYYDSLPEDTQLQIKVELRRIDYIRRVIESSDADKSLAARVTSSVSEWRKYSKKEVEKVTRWSAIAKPERKGYRAHNPNATRQAKEVKPEDYDPNKDFNAYYIEYVKSEGKTNTELRPSGEFLYKNKFPNQKLSVHNLLYDKSINPLSRKKLAADAAGQPPDRIRYFHLPANNMKWVEDAIARYYDEESPQYDTAYRKAEPPSCATMLLRRDFWLGQEHGRGSPIIHTRHMRPLCEPVSSGG